jgi:hypothetical protein
MLLRSGSCYTFSVVAAIEAAQALWNTAGASQLSEQMLLRCCDASGGCNGGYIDKMASCAENLHILETTDKFPYDAHSVDDSCPYTSQSTQGLQYSAVGPAFGVGSWFSVSGEEKYQSILDADGTCTEAYSTAIAVCFDASKPSFQSYSSGIYSDPACSTSKTDHCVAITGFGTDNGQDYWKVGRAGFPYDCFLI